MICANQQTNSDKSGGPNPTARAFTAMDASSLYTPNLILSQPAPYFPISSISIPLHPSISTTTQSHPASLSALLLSTTLSFTPSCSLLHSTYMYVSLSLPTPPPFQNYPPTKCKPPSQYHPVPPFPLSPLSFQSHCSLPLPPLPSNPNSHVFITLSHSHT